MRKFLYLVLLPIVFLILIFTKPKGAFKQFYKYFAWSIILFYVLNIIRLFFWPDSFLAR